jgi:ABC-type multidrug transport system permease subunit
MFRTILGYAVLAIVGVIALKLIFGVIGVVFSLLWVVLWLAFLGFVFYLILKVVSPTTAQRVKDSIKGTQGGE